MQYARCLKITEKVSFNIASEASYIYKLSGQKFIKNAKNSPFWRKIKNATFLVIFKHCDQISVVVKKNIYFSDVFGREVFLQVEIVLSLSYQVSQHVHTGAKIHICSKKSHVQNHKIHETHIFKIAFFAQFTF